MQVNDLPKLASDTCDLLNQAATWFLLISHDRHGFACDLNETEEVDLHLESAFVLGEFLKRPAKTVACIVADDVNPSKLVQRRLERCVDIGLLGNIELEGEIILIGGLVELQDLRLPSCSNDIVPTIEDLLDVEFAEAGGTAGDQEYTRHDGSYRR